MDLDSSPDRTMQRRLILRDSFAFLVLTLITVALFLVTLFLFNSFTSHRAELAKRWYARGQHDLAASHPAQAVAALRIAIDYAPSDSAYSFLLAEALGQTGKTDEAYAYFLNLRETDPGSGPLNLQLARLSDRQHRAGDMVHFYRAAIYGTWGNDSKGNNKGDSKPSDDSGHRRAARLELIQALLRQGDLATARTELLIASEDAEEDPASLPGIASMMAEAGDPAAALTLYRKALARDPGDQLSLEGAGNAAYTLGHFASAQRYLLSATQQSSPAALAPDSASHLAEADRVLELFPSPSLSRGERADRIEHLAALSQAQLQSCHQQSPGNDAGFDDLDRQWKTAGKRWPETKLRNDPTAQQEQLQLIYQTLEHTRNICKAQSGDDVALQRIAHAPDAVLQ